MYVCARKRSQHWRVNSLKCTNLPKDLLFPVASLPTLVLPDWLKTDGLEFGMRGWEGAVWLVFEATCEAED